MPAKTATAKVDREKFLHCLESVEPGLDAKEGAQQSNCFAFQKGSVHTYNDWFACRIPCGLPRDFSGATPAKPLLAILAKLPDQELAVSVTDSQLTFAGTRKQLQVRLEAEVSLPISVVETPGDWKPLPDDFGAAISLVAQCAGKEESRTELTCVHITPKWVEACDNAQLCRWQIKTGIGSTLIRHTGVKHLAALAVTEVAETVTWVHFRNAAGLIFSCRRYLEGEYKDFTAMLDVEGTELALPRGKELEKAIEAAEEFARENDDKSVRVELRQNKLRLVGQGVNGRYRHWFEVQYAGEDISFLVAPKILADIARRDVPCVVSPDRLRVREGKYTWVTCLFDADEVEEGKDE